MMDPPLMLADEPTGNLDTATGEQVLGLIKGTVDGRRTVVLVTHDPRIADHADRIITIHDGRIVKDELTQARSDLVASVGP